MLFADSRSKRPVPPWPSGVLAGMPSARSLTPRTPKPARAPNPRTMICCSWEKVSRFCTTVPGMRTSASEMLTPCRCSWIVSLSIELIAMGKSKLDCSTRVGVTTIGARRTASSCAAEIPEPRINTATQAGFRASSNETARILRPPLICSNSFFNFVLCSAGGNRIPQAIKKGCSKAALLVWLCS